MSKGHLHANMWRRSGEVAPLKSSPSIKRRDPLLLADAPLADGEHSARIATNIAEARFGSRADKLLRRFSWQDDDE